MNPNPVYIEAQAVMVEKPVLNHDGSYQAFPVNDLANSMVSSAPVSGINEAGARDFLSGQKWPPGLQDTFIKNLSKIPIRFFICDDSGSMVSNDGHKLIDANGKKKLISCSRWAELTEALKFHAGISHAACAPSEFRLLNGAQPILVGNNDEQDQNRYQSLLAIFENSPSGGTPLCHHINQVIQKIRGMEQQLRSSGQKACVVIATDGESSDGDIATAMRPLQSLPVWVVIRLCTDDEKIVNYWNNIDSQLELDMDVLDDLCGEAGEVMENNNWLTYGEPMHRLREFGIPIKEIDLLDEQSLSVEQIRLFASLIFGGGVESYPHPQADFRGFLEAIQRENKRLPQVWHPVDQVPRDWINVTRLRRMNPTPACCTIS